MQQTFFSELKGGHPTAIVPPTHERPTLHTLSILCRLGCEIAVSACTGLQDWLPHSHIAIQTKAILRGSDPYVCLKQEELRALLSFHISFLTDISKFHHSCTQALQNPPLEMLRAGCRKPPINSCQVIRAPPPKSAAARMNSKFSIIYILYESARGTLYRRTTFASNDTASFRSQRQRDKAANILPLLWSSHPRQVERAAQSQDIVLIPEMRCRGFAMPHLYIGRQKISCA